MRDGFVGATDSSFLPFDGNPLIVKVARRAE